MPFSLARRICTFVENENVKEKCFKELKETLLEQKYHKSLIEASILRAKEIPLEVLRQPKTTKNEEIIPFTIIYNPKISDVFPTIKKGFDNFQYSKRMLNIFQRKNVERLFCRSTFESQQKNDRVKKNCRKNCASCPYLLKVFLITS